ncbi:hypothetical protein AMR42_07975 [Limnothrix sp. PR1529]|nr:hypothetical protein BCR12_03375 [Limnothrix sp. P13C2]PIB13922.1 hypothetical protein AMR42_07975 [Limnothrix sp. PR1529]
MLDRALVGLRSVIVATEASRVSCSNHEGSGNSNNIHAGSAVPSWRGCLARICFVFCLIDRLVDRRVDRLVDRLVGSV